MAKTGVFYRNGHYYGTPSRDAENVKFDNTISKLSAGTVKAAIDELASLKTTGQLTKLKTISASTDTTITAIDSTKYRKLVLVFFAGGVSFSRDINVNLLTTTAVNYQVGGTAYAGSTYYVASAGVYISKTSLQLALVQNNNMTFDSINIYGET